MPDGIRTSFGMMLESTYLTVAVWPPSFSTIDLMLPDFTSWRNVTTSTVGGDVLCRLTARTIATIMTTSREATTNFALGIFMHTSPGTQETWIESPIGAPSLLATRMGTIALSLCYRDGSFARHTHGGIHHHGCVSEASAWVVRQWRTTTSPSVRPDTTSTLP